jgi:diguanylate cyclase (GGDEF)-like protein
LKILVADDDGVSRKILTTMLTKWGYDVSVVCDGKQALDAMQSPDAPLLAILDGMMPEMDGVDVCREIRMMQTDVRPYLILLTGRENKADLVMGIDAGADDYLIKPCEPEELKVRIRAGVRIVDLQTEALAAKRALEHQASHDGLTGILNRAAVLDGLARELSRARRSGATVSVVMIDLDHFKHINDSHGHGAGDTVLVEAVKRMMGQIRPYEDLGRYGGEEFLAVLSDCDVARAMHVAERLRLAICEEVFRLKRISIEVTASFGVADSTQVESCTPEQLIHLADAALYRAKENGRNCTEIATAEEHGRSMTCAL